MALASAALLALAVFTNLQAPSRAELVQVPLRQRERDRPVEWKDEAERQGGVHPTLAQFYATPGGVWRELLHDFNNIVYTATLHVGSPAREVNLIVDTGSSDLWVRQKEQGGSSLAASASRPSAGSFTQLSYGSGTISGLALRDQVCLGSKMCIPDQNMVLAETFKNLPNHLISDQTGVDGILGLGFPALVMETVATGKVDTFLQSLQRVWHFETLAFSLDLHGPDDESALNIGELEDVMKASAATSGPGFTLPVVYPDGASEPLYWMIPGMVAGSLSPLAMDSGTTLLVAPYGRLDAVHSEMLSEEDRKKCHHAENTALLECPCDVPLKPLDFVFLDAESPDPEKSSSFHTVRLERSDLLLGPFSPNDSCYLSIQAAPQGMDFWVLGSIFMRKVSVIFDVPGQRVIMRPRAESSSPRGLSAANGPNPSRRMVWAAGVLALVAVSFLQLRKMRREAATRRAHLSMEDTPYQSLLSAKESWFSS